MIRRVRSTCATVNLSQAMSEIIEYPNATNRIFEHQNSIDDDGDLGDVAQL